MNVDKFAFRPGSENPYLQTRNFTFYTHCDDSKDVSYCPECFKV